jgi:adenylate cyclase
MSVDPGGTLSALDGAREVFRRHSAEHQGHVIDTAGDSVLAVFQTATGAVEAAMAVQRELAVAANAIPEPRRMRFRIGVHLGDVIEKDDGSIYGDGVNIAARLQSHAEPGGITISDAVRGAVRNRVPASFEDQGEHQMKNIAEPVRAFRVAALRGVVPQAKAAAAMTELTLPDKPSIAVLPFANLSGDPEQEFFTDGITDDITTELSRFHTLFVIARNSSFTYKGKAIDVRTVAKELGVRYVLEGSIRRAGNRIRLTGQLVDALSGAHVWAERYDRVLADVFAMQEELTRSIVTAIAPQIEAAEMAKIRRARPGSLTAYEIALHAYAEAWLAYGDDNREARNRAIELAREALALDPQSLVALRSLAFAQFQHLYFGSAVAAERARDEGLDAATRALALDSSDHLGHLWKGMLLYVSEQYEAGLESIRRAHELNPNDPSVLQGLGWTEASSGNPQKGIEHLTNALRMSPRDFSRYNTLTILGLVGFLARDYQRGMEWSLAALREVPKSPAVHMALTLNYIGLGHMEKAQAEIEMLRRLDANFFRSTGASRANFARKEDRERASTFLLVAAGKLDAGTLSGLR